MKGLGCAAAQYTVLMYHTERATEIAIVSYEAQTHAQKYASMSECTTVKLYMSTSSGLYSVKCEAGGEVTLY